jgi:hypothetical protein
MARRYVRTKGRDGRERKRILELFSQVHPSLPFL